MALRLPPLSGLRLFEAAARCGSFKRAAQELNLTPGALSHGIDSLEHWLDVELFAFRVLLPRLYKFQEQYPNMQVKVDASRFVVQLESNQIDLAIRNSRDAVPKMSCDLIGRVSFVPVGAPHYIDKLSRGGTLDWSRATVIHTSAASDDWETWCNQSQIDISSSRGLIVSSAQVAFQAARDGLGVAIGRLPLIDDDIAAGRLAVAVDHVVPVMSAYWLVKPPGNETRREIVAFRNWLLNEMSQLKWNGDSETKPVSKRA
jgi:DNA-binding transcriptional LysR family regulator